MARHITGREATYVAIKGNARGPIRLASPSDAEGPVPQVSASSDLQPHSNVRKAPPRVRRPDDQSDRCLASTSDLEAHRAALRQAFGQTLSNEFAEVMLGKLVAALRPGPFDSLDEASLNAAIALIVSINPETELEALLAVQIAATGFAGLKFLRQSQHHMDEVFIGVYGGFATKLLRLQLEMLTVLDRHRRGNKQTVEVRHVHIHPGAQGVVGIVNPTGKGGDQK